MSEEPAATSDGWQECFSKTHKKQYWFNVRTGKTSWEDPHAIKSVAVEGAPSESRKRSRENPSTEVPQERALKVSESKISSTEIRPVIAIIVPYRDLHVEQKRKQHLDTFIPAMIQFLSRPGGPPFRIYIIEQSDDRRKFNRGKLLNIGFQIASKEGCRTFIFHDVDLLPSPDLFECYATIPRDTQPMHIARVWDRYSGNKKYFGGITSFSETSFRRMNGFPNNFWGWGGEDDELYRRAVKVATVV
jgi:hypothetical protein